MAAEVENLCANATYSAKLGASERATLSLASASSHLNELKSYIVRQKAAGVSEGTALELGNRYNAARQAYNEARGQTE